MTAEQPIAVSGSERLLPPGAERTGDAAPDEQVTVSVMVRTRPGAAAAATAPPSSNSLRERQRQRSEYAAGHGADPADIAAVVDFAAAHRLRVVASDAARRTVILSADAAAMSSAFGVSLGRYQLRDASFRGREGHVQIPADLADIVTAVLGLDNRPQAHAHFVLGDPLQEAALPDPSEDPVQRLSAAAAHRGTKTVPLWATHVASLYNFPTTDDLGTTLDGHGQTIAIIELGGGYTDANLDAYFTRAGVARPTVTAVGVGAGANSPGGDADGEVQLDIEVAGTVAPGAEVVVYFAEGADDRSFLDALTTAVHDQTYAPQIISISWGGPEPSWTAQAAAEFDRALTDAADLGVTVLVAAGDHGAGDAFGDGQPHADLPAASPHVIACGGTTLTASGTGIVSEVVWNDGDGWAGGGGFSSVFPVPAFQTGLPAVATGRGVPDIAGNADITSGYIVLVNGRWGPVGGTSAVAPLWAGLVALLNQALGRPVGYLNHDLYPAANTPGVFRDITHGDNSTPASTQFGPAVTGYTATTGWDACTGLGSVDGIALLKALK